MRIRLAHSFPLALALLIALMLGVPRLFNTRSLQSHTGHLGAVSELDYNPLNYWEVELSDNRVRRRGIRILDPFTLENLEQQAAIANLVRTKGNLRNTRRVAAGKIIQLKNNRHRYTALLISPRGEVFATKRRNQTFSVKTSRRNQLATFDPSYYDRPSKFDLPHQVPIRVLIEGNKLQISKINNDRTQVLVQVARRTRSHGYLIRLTPPDNNEDPTRDEEDALPDNQDASRNTPAPNIEPPVGDPASNAPIPDPQNEQPVTEAPPPVGGIAPPAADAPNDSTHSESGCPIHDDAAECDCSIPGCSRHPCATACVVGSYDENGNKIESCCGNGTVEQRWEIHNGVSTNVGEQCDKGGGVTTPIDTHDCVGCRLKCDIDLEAPDIVEEVPGNSFVAKIVVKSKSKPLTPEFKASPSFCAQNECYNSRGQVSAQTLQEQLNVVPEGEYSFRVSDYLWYGLSQNANPSDPELCYVQLRDNGLYSPGTIGRQGLYTLFARVEFENGCVASKTKEIRVAQRYTANEVYHKVRENGLRRPVFTYRRNGTNYCATLSCDNNDCFEVTTEVAINARDQYEPFVRKEEYGHKIQFLGNVSWRSSGGNMEDGYKITDWSKFAATYDSQTICVPYVESWWRANESEAPMREQIHRIYETKVSKYRSDIEEWHNYEAYCWREYAVKRNIGLLWPRASYHYHCTYVLPHRECPDEATLVSSTPQFFWDWAQGRN